MVNSANRICPVEIKLPERIARLQELAYNLWWSWNPSARKLFQDLDLPLWFASGHNPIKQLKEISYQTLKSAARDKEFLRSYDIVMNNFDEEMASADNLYNNATDPLSGGIAFFSMEFAIHQSLPIYAGGLGVLAGDICKEASDLGLPFIAIGFMYPQGYFHQRISIDGWQEEIYRMVDFNIIPANPCLIVDRDLPLTEVQINARKLFIKTWLVRIGRVNLYLLDTDLEENSPQDRLLTARLYTSEKEQRLQQEILLGIVGVRILQTLGYEPSVWHANEGHTSFMMIERLRQEIQRGKLFSEAVQKIRESTIFTTHTPLAAGHDVFPEAMVSSYLRGCWKKDEIHWKNILDLGRFPDKDSKEFNMTALGLRLSGVRNAVSKIHKETSCKMWRSIWPETNHDSVHILQVTNGVHLPTWIAPEMRELFSKYLGDNWLQFQDDETFWERIALIPDEELWEIRKKLKSNLISVMLARNRECSGQRTCSTDQILAMGAMFDTDSLTLGFVRRFAEYKRPALVLRDIELLKTILIDKKQPVQLVFAGKSHPADFASKCLLNEVYSIALDREFEGRIAFIEDFDIHLAHNLVAGVDVWLNTPRRLEEACGTSGMKAALNGGLNFSVPDGWWPEAFNGSNGWEIGDTNKIEDPFEEDISDINSLYNILQNEIIPLYYNQDRAGIPRDWVRMIKESIRSVTPKFCSRKMMKEYSKLYTIMSHREQVI